MFCLTERKVIANERFKRKNRQRKFEGLQLECRRSKIGTFRVTKSRFDGANSKIRCSGRSSGSVYRNGSRVGRSSLLGGKSNTPHCSLGLPVYPVYRAFRLECRCFSAHNATSIWFNRQLLVAWDSGWPIRGATRSWLCDQYLSSVENQSNYELITGGRSWLCSRFTFLTKFGEFGRNLLGQIRQWRQIIRQNDRLLIYISLKGNLTYKFTFWRDVENL